MNGRLCGRWAISIGVPLLACTMGTQAALPGPPEQEAVPTVWSTIVTGMQVSEAERLALVDLQRYVAQITRQTPRVMDVADWRARPVPAVAVGTLASNPLLREVGDAAKELGEEGYVLANGAEAGQPLVLAGAETSAGAVNAMYGLLRELGCGFYLGSESLPAGLPSRLPFEKPLVRKPALAVRGVLPWYNFLNSPTTWDPVDHRAVIDQLIRSGANFIGFHTYNGEPFAAYPEGGEMKQGARLRNTRSPIWDTHPLPTSQYYAGTGQLFADEYFGAATTQSTEPDNRVIQREQDVVRDAFDYALRRGVRTCIGFEITGDPTDTQTREVALKRLNRLLDQYPSLDYLWIWQSESHGPSGYRGTVSQPLELLGAFRYDVFRRIAELKSNLPSHRRYSKQSVFRRAIEGARLEQFATLARRCLRQRENAPRLVVSGWGGEEYLLASEYFEGLDKLLPQDVIFSVLDHISVKPKVDRIYAELPSARERWPIPWLEWDGDQWQPQPLVHVYEKLMRSVESSGSQGLLGIHWRTRDIEENLAYLIERAWQPGLTADAFFDQLAGRCYPLAISSQMASIHKQLDRLGYRWVGGGGQNECMGFTFSPGGVEASHRLQQLRTAAAELLPRAGPSAARLKWLLARMDFTLKYTQAETAAREAQKLFEQGKPAEALARLDAGDLPGALHAYSERLTTRGEYGVLATINGKAVFAWNELRGRCLAALKRGDEARQVPEWTPERQVVLPRFFGSIRQGEDWELMPISLGGDPVWLHYRPLGQTAWRSMPLRPVKGWVWRANVPAGELEPPGMEFAFSFSASPARPFAWGPAAVSVMPAMGVHSLPRPRRAFDVMPSLELHCGATNDWPFVLQWRDLEEADYYSVSRDGQQIAETCAAFFPDAPTSPAPSHEYGVEAWRQGRVIAKQSLSIVTPDVEVGVALMPSFTCVEQGAVIEWPASASKQVASIKVVRSAPDSTNAFTVVGQHPAIRGGTQRIRVALTNGNTLIRLIPFNQAGRELIPVSIPLRWPDAAFGKVRCDDLLQKAEARGPVSREAEKVRFVMPGYLERPYEPLFDLKHGGALSFEFQADKLGEVNVLLSHGNWMTSGWQIDISGKRLNLKTTFAKSVGPVIEAGRWYQVRWEYDGLNSRLWLDGQPVGETCEIPELAASAGLRIGSPHEPFYGTIRKLSLTAWMPKNGQNRE